MSPDYLLKAFVLRRNLKNKNEDEIGFVWLTRRNLIITCCNSSIRFGWNEYSLFMVVQCGINSKFIKLTVADDVCLYPYLWYMLGWGLFCENHNKQCVLFAITYIRVQLKLFIQLFISSVHVKNIEICRIISWIHSYYNFKKSDLGFLWSCHIVAITYPDLLFAPMSYAAADFINFAEFKCYKSF